MTTRTPEPQPPEPRCGPTAELPPAGAQPAWPGARSRDGGVDRVPLAGLAGELWLCGKHAVCPDPERTMAEIGATMIVCLNQEHELADRYPEYVFWLNANNRRRAVWFPIADLHAPSEEAIRPLLDQLTTLLVGGERLLVHCGAGIGRAGTLAVCLLIGLGTERDDALQIVASHRPMAGPEVGRQRDLVDAIALSVKAGRGTGRERPATKPGQ